jgi:hypothetical protein
MQWVKRWHLNVQDTPCFHAKKDGRIKEVSRKKGFLCAA